MPARRILIVDDEESFRHMLSVILFKEGYEVETASNGEEGLRKAAASPFDQILVRSAYPSVTLSAVGFPFTLIVTCDLISDLYKSNKRHLVQHCSHVLQPRAFPVSAFHYRW